MKLLVIEDEPRMVTLLVRGLSEEGHQVDACSTGGQALHQAKLVAYDVILLDWGLPDLDGLSVLRTLREQGVTTPVLMLTARGQTGEKVMGLRTGADDYLVKPFDFDELVARLEALARRQQGKAVAPLGELELDERRRGFVFRQRFVELSQREWQLARCLFERRGELVTRAELLRDVWGADYGGEANVIDVYIGYLRAKLAELGLVELIRTVRGSGYRLVPPASGL